MAAFYKKSYSVVRDRLMKGWSLELALTTPVKKRRGKKIVAPNGTVFDSLQQLCTFYGLPCHRVRMRLKRGYTLGEALDEDLFSREVVFDHLGHKFESVSEMARFYDISVSTLYNRLNLNWTLCQALTTSMNKKRQKKV